MKFEIGSNQGGYFIVIRSNDGFYDSGDREIAELLNIKLKKYKKILKKHNVSYTLFGMHFRIKEDCEQCIEELNPYLIMRELTI